MYLNKWRVIGMVLMMFIVSIGASQAQDVVLMIQTPVQGVYQAELQAGKVIIPIRWLTNFGLDDATSLQVEQILPSEAGDEDGQLVDVLIPQTTRWKVQPGLAYANPLWVDGLAFIHLRATLIHGSEPVATGDYVIPIFDEARPESSNQLNPIISQFDLVRTESAGDDFVFMEMRWQVENKPDNSNLVFEQVLPDSSVVNVERERIFMMLSSTGQGVGALQAPPPTANSVMVRLRLVDLQTGLILAEEVTTALHTSVLPTATPPPVPTASVPAITNFAILPDMINRAGEITFDWETQGMTSLGITRLSEVGGIFLESIGDNLPASGQLTYQLPANYTDQAEFLLIGTDANGTTYQASASVAISCPFQPAYDTSCPLTQQSTSVASQVFEHGLMVWRGDRRLIYVMFNDGSFETFADNWVVGTPIDTPTDIPDGLYAPERGFGLLWTTNPSVRDRVGWALTFEEAMETVIETRYLWRNGMEALSLRIPQGVLTFPTSIGTWTYLE